MFPSPSLGKPVKEPESLPYPGLASLWMWTQDPPKPKSRNALGKVSHIPQKYDSPDFQMRLQGMEPCAKAEALCELNKVRRSRSQEPPELSIQGCNPPEREDQLGASNVPSHAFTARLEELQVEKVPGEEAAIPGSETLTGTHVRPHPGEAGAPNGPQKSHISQQDPPVGAEERGAPAPPSDPQTPASAPPAWAHPETAVAGRGGGASQKLSASAADAPPASPLPGSVPSTWRPETRAVAPSHRVGRIRSSGAAARAGAATFPRQRLQRVWLIRPPLLPTLPGPSPLASPIQPAAAARPAPAPRSPSVPLLPLPAPRPHAVPSAGSTASHRAQSPESAPRPAGGESPEPSWVPRLRVRGSFQGPVVVLEEAASPDESAPPVEKLPSGHSLSRR
ncbi:hypothetical protein P7K49_020576 [Saguinus oedipus]|uniref:Uncharacterized protein n=1 Tax=Saguinus oedipus TaxID=9490 RepID=A0ABQ9V1N7_SAGOE|nr:hypothetical protein P7K49_020576 [Saguinus oedipus]